jgi:hypothetical protein
MLVRITREGVPGDGPPGPSAAGRGVRVGQNAWTREQMGRMRWNWRPSCSDAAVRWLTRRGPHSDQHLADQAWAVVAIDQPRKGEEQ